MPITTLTSLRQHLQTALVLEHSTIPPYLCALYSIPDGSNVEVARLIRSVVMEEMLHMVLVANLLNAIGGKPQVYHKEFVPAYPTCLPHSDRAFLVELLPFGTKAIDTFMKIERPTPAKARPKGDNYHTIGQFYAAIAEGFKHLARTPSAGRKLFCGRPARQVAGEKWYYGGGGAPVAVRNLKTALAAIAEIAEQGEGFEHTLYDGDSQFGQVDELAHYFRFYEIRCARRFAPSDSPGHRPTGTILPVDWHASLPMRPNPKAKLYHKRRPEVYALMVAFNRQYTALLRCLHQAFNGEQEQLKAAVPIMYDLKYRAQALMNTPTGRKDGTTVGPSFEFMP